MFKPNHISIGLSNGLVKAGDKPLPELILINVTYAYKHHQAPVIYG